MMIWTYGKHSTVEFSFCYEVMMCCERQKSWFVIA